MLILPFTTIVASYLSNADSLAAGVPTVLQAPRRTADSGEEFVMPCIAITGRETVEAGSRRTVTITAELLLRYDLTQLPAWHEALQLRMRDTQALMAFLAALPEPQRTGWHCYRLQPVAPDIEREPGDVAVRYASSVEFRCFV